MDKLLYTPEEAAELLGIGRTRLFELIAKGRLESVRLGRSRRVPGDALRSFAKRLREREQVDGVLLTSPGGATGGWTLQPPSTVCEGLAYEDDRWDLVQGAKAI